VINPCLARLPKQLQLWLLVALVGAPERRSCFYTAENEPKIVAFSALGEAISQGAPPKRP